MRAVRGGRIGMIFQEPGTSLNPVLTVGQQMRETIETHTALRGDAARAKAIDWLRRVGIPEPERRFNDYPFRMSGGQKQRVMIAMTLAAEPDYLIADEPTTALDVTIQKQILDLLRDLQREQGMGLLLITHDLAVVAGMAHQVALMYAGQIIEVAPAAQFSGLFGVNQRFAVGAAASLALTPFSRVPADPEGVEREHARVYLMADMVGRMNLLVYPNYRGFLLASTGLVVISDTYRSLRGVTDRALVGPRGVTLRTEGFGVGVGFGIETWLSSLTTLGGKIHSGLWLLPSERATDALGDHASMSGVNSFVMVTLGVGLSNDF